MSKKKELKKLNKKIKHLQKKLDEHTEDDDVRDECTKRQQALQDIMNMKRQLGDDALDDFDRAEMSLYGLRGTAACALLAAVYVIVYKCYYMIPVVVILGFLIAGYTQRINNIKRKMDWCVQ